MVAVHEDRQSFVGCVVLMLFVCFHILIIVCWCCFWVVDGFCVFCFFHIPCLSMFQIVFSRVEVHGRGETGCQL